MNRPCVLCVFTAMIFLFSPAVVSGMAISGDATVWIDAASCGFYVKNAEKRDSFQSEKTKIKPHDRGYSLLVVELEGRSPSDGVLVIYPEMFGALYGEGDKSIGVASRAIGEKYTTKDGEEKEFWIVKKKNAITLARETLERDKEITIYAIFDLPNDWDSFLIQVPSLLPGETTVKVVEDD